MPEVVIAAAIRNTIGRFKGALAYGHANHIDTLIQDGLSDASTASTWASQLRNLVDKYGISREEQDGFTDEC
ncbi:putative acetyl-CoA acyltransferase [compost metagenome]